MHAAIALLYYVYLKKNDLVVDAANTKPPTKG